MDRPGKQIKRAVTDPDLQRVEHLQVAMDLNQQMGEAEAEAEVEAEELAGVGITTEASNPTSFLLQMGNKLPRSSLVWQRPD